MSNEEITEEIYHYAHSNGFINQLNDEVKKLRSFEPSISEHDRVHKAYHEIIDKMNLPGVAVE
jgi:hypothetical protein